MPKFLAVTIDGRVTSTGGVNSFYWISPSTGSVYISDNNSTYAQYVAVSGTTVSWYSSLDASRQLNATNYIFHYVAFGC